jgi:hypothetical protein
VIHFMKNLFLYEKYPFGAQTLGGIIKQGIVKMTKDVQESGDSKGRIIGSLGSEPSATMQAALLLDSLVSSLGEQNFDMEELPRLMKMYMHALHLLGIDDKWVSDELRGYSDIKKMPSYRRQFCNTEYIAVGSGKLVEKTHESHGFSHSVGFLVNHRVEGWHEDYDSPDKLVGEKLVDTIRRITTDKWVIDVVLDRIAVELFARASEILVTAKFGAAIDTIFREYQKAVGSALSNLGIADHLGTAYINLRGSDEASWRAAALACRNVLHDLSVKLWCVQCVSYNFGDDRGLVELNNPRIKLRAYMREKGLDKKDTAVALLEPLYSQGSAGKEIECSYEDARSTLIETYLFVAELVRQTDMKPVTEIKKGSSKGKE